MYVVLEPYLSSKLDWRHLGVVALHQTIDFSATGKKPGAFIILAASVHTLVQELSNFLVLGAGRRI